MPAKRTKSAAHFAKRRNGSTNGKLPTYHESIRRRLSKVPGVDAVYTWVDGHNSVVHVVSVVQEHRSKIYDKLIPQEDRVEKDHPDVPFDFHVRARQKRTVENVVPASGYLVFKK